MIYIHIYIYIIYIHEFNGHFLHSGDNIPNRVPRDYRGHCARLVYFRSVPLFSFTIGQLFMVDIFNKQQNYTFSPAIRSSRVAVEKMGSLSQSDHGFLIKWLTDCNIM